MTDEETENLLTEEFGRYCQFCKRYDKGICLWDSTGTWDHDGENCLLFEFDDSQKKILMHEYAMRSQEGKVDNVWKRWLMAQH